MPWDHPAFIAIAGALVGAAASFLLQGHQNGKAAKQQDEHALREKVYDLESRLARLEVEMELFDRTGKRTTRRRGRHV